MPEAKTEFRATLNYPVVKTAAKLYQDKYVLIWTADATEKILRTSLLPKNAGRATCASASAAGHEYTSLFFVINPRKELKNLKASAGELVSDKGKISCDNITLRYVDYARKVIENDRLEFVSFVKDSFMDYPDPLPLIAGRKLNAKANENFMLWATVYVPEGTVAGTYKGKITVTADDGFSRNLDVEIKVHGFSLPRKTHIKSMYTVQHFYGGLPNFEKQYIHHWPEGVKPFNDMYKQMCSNILKNYGEYRITPELFQYQFSCFTFEEKLAMAEKYKFDPPFTLGYNITNNYIAAEPITPEKRQKLFNGWKKAGENAKAKGIADISFVKISDEPESDIGVQEGLIKYTLMAGEDFKKAAPYIQSFIAFTQWPRDPLPLMKIVDAWCMQWNRFDFASENAKQLLANGNKLWVYAAEYKPNFGYMPVDLRAPYWLYWKYNITGMHFSHHVPSVFLNYPNVTYPYSDGLSPIPSIRWEMMRHGIQDYEYLWLLNDLINKNGARGNKYKPLLTVPENLAKAEDIYTNDPGVINKRREQIAKAIEELSK